MTEQRDPNSVVVQTPLGRPVLCSDGLSTGDMPFSIFLDFTRILAHCDQGRVHDVQQQ